MRHSFFIVILFSILTTFSCNDGDIITVEFDFDDTFSACEGVSDIVFYNTKNDPSESLSVLIPSFSLETILAVEENDSLIIENLAVTFNYRTYSNSSISNLFCNDIPNSEIDITSDEESSSTIKILTILTEDDNDGVPAELEDINGNGNLKDDDTDGDGIPNFKDVDDDGDNILTRSENPDPNADGLLNDAQDTDGDGIPDYLDDDDDGDGALTRDEETNTQNNNPIDDVTNSDIGPDYLNANVITNIPATAFRQHTISKTYEVFMTVFNIALTNLFMEELNFGRLENSNLSETEILTPDFN
ncbi:MAG: hypothetical protein GW839_05015 [Flavobacteriales bacterium]|nr:hypothetical protein [Flavobacteriia bacterium]NCP05003.1 hypothetical protein [Flavobacteriales bacterium]PIV94214.1 MAG: hypothetical protein COW44_05290 [Flavobacteriaceae bacterium CG17_big_fil_post_rev_8_21_14_2_50_33_15]PIY11330.1 MAG: hypothetical protein COZ17_07065 [Flavobacteriaceae bacterium CG_4_10_14_3_um_filter_33_47]PJB19389.1 MAG: hypothetical protein CO117_04675 [Flavobacteriaceae bacterium CG_4_9_14_3_um_filter_33_16]